MSLHYQDDWLTVYHGDCREVMAGMEPESVHCVVTSPPYWGLRDYGTATWIGGDANHDHSFVADAGATTQRVGRSYQQGHPHRDCSCGATRQDSQLGLERTPEEYVANMVAVFREVRRVLRADGTVWLNLGDSYAATGGHTGYGESSMIRSDDQKSARNFQAQKVPPGLKPKDLVGIPWLVARALQEPYYTGRIKRERDRVWLAAMIDAEGTICGFRHERPDANVRTGMLVFITNSDVRVLDEADRIWPGARYLDHNHAGDDMGHGIIANRDSWRWQIQKADERSAFVREMYPYLISKRQQAAVAWNLLEFTKAALRMGRGGETLEVKAKREVLVGLLSDLNHYRPVVIPSWVKEPPGMTEPGWYLRSDIIWSKNNPMPESVTDRPTKSHEYLFLLSKSPRYYFDADAVREPHQHPEVAHISTHIPSGAAEAFRGNPPTNIGRAGNHEAGRNIRSVWTIATAPYPGAHFATFPPKLVEPCIKAGTSEKGVCPECGAPWEREVERSNTEPQRAGDWKATGESHRNDIERKGGFYTVTTATGWRPGCRCERDGGGWAPVGATVLDPFAGSGTTGMVAQSLSRRAVLIDLSLDYLGQLMDRNADIPLGLGA